MEVYIFMNKYNADYMEVSIFINKYNVIQTDRYSIDLSGDNL